MKAPITDKLPCFSVSMNELKKESCRSYFPVSYWSRYLKLRIMSWTLYRLSNEEKHLLTLRWADLKRVTLLWCPIPIWKCRAWARLCPSGNNSLPCPWSDTLFRPWVTGLRRCVPSWRTICVFSIQRSPSAPSQHFFHFQDPSPSVLILPYSWALFTFFVKSPFHLWVVAYLCSRIWDRMADWRVQSLQKSPPWCFQWRTCSQLSVPRSSISLGRTNRLRQHQMEG